MARKRLRRWRTEAPPPESDQPMTEQDRARVLSRYSCLKGRGVTLRYRPYATVAATTPEEAIEAYRSLMSDQEDN